MCTLKIGVLSLPGEVKFESTNSIFNERVSNLFFLHNLIRIFVTFNHHGMGSIDLGNIYIPNYYKLSIFNGSLGRYII